MLTYKDVPIFGCANTIMDFEGIYQYVSHLSALGNKINQTFRNRLIYCCGVMCRPGQIRSPHMAHPETPRATHLAKVYQ